MQERLQKFLSNAGIASRRRAETMILAGEITINGKTAKLGDKVDPDKDKILYKGKTVKPEEQMYYIAVNKPRGYISSRFDPNGRKSVYSLLPKDLQNKVWNVGRLDFFTEGLMLFTNDGELTQLLSHPSHEHEKEYEVQLNKDISEIPHGAFEKLKKGIEVGETFYQPAKIKLAHGKVYITIHEGRKHQIRRMFEAVGYKVKSLKRIRIGKLTIDGIFLGKTKMLKKEDII